MATEKVNLAVIIKNPSTDAEILLIKQAPPPKFNDPEYDSYQDSDLWDLPCSQLSNLDNSLVSNSRVEIEAEDNSLLEFLKGFDLNSALNQIVAQVGFETAADLKWKASKVIDEPEFGPGISSKTVYVIGDLELHDWKPKDPCKWMSTKGCADLLLSVKPHNDRVGPLAVVGLLNDTMQNAALNIPSSLTYQEYPPGVKVVPMGSSTAKPFRTTNLVVFLPGTSSDVCDGDSFIASGDAIIVDPGCKSAFNKELEQIVSALPRKLFVFVTHHHFDHTDGLSVVLKSNPDAILLAHENTFQRLRKGHWSGKYIPVKGAEEISVGGQPLKTISAPGHTDGHMALLHVTSNSLIVGDHCVGQGSALLDINGGGNMTDYFQTTYRFMELSPHVLIPMHGRVGLWPKHMLCGYLKNRRNRESSILKAIEGGARTLYDMVSSIYADVDRALWYHAASNVRLHVDHLAHQNKLPKEFSVQRFQSTCGMNFILRWMWAYTCGYFSIKRHQLQMGILLAAGSVVAVGASYYVKEILYSKKHI